MTPITKITAHPVPAFNDNYLWVIQNGRYVAVVDPGEASPVIEYLSTAIICSHRQADHVGGIEKLFNFPQLRGKIRLGRDICADAKPARVFGTIRGLKNNF